MTFIWHNGAFKDDSPVLTIHDRVRLGEGVFNTMLVRDGHIFHAPLHFKKLLENSRLFWGAWSAPSAESLDEIAYALLKKNDFVQGDFAFNTIITGGEAGNGIRTPEPPAPHIMMRVLPLQILTAPVHAVVAQTVRRNEGSPLSRIKCSNYGDHILALREAQSKGANEAFVLNNRGALACATTANIVIVQGGKLYTPPLSDGPQNGVTRTILLQKYDVTEKSFFAEDLQHAEGFYVLNSLRGCVPVARLDNRPLSLSTPFIPQDFALS